jgi:hypothetical protein
MEHKRNRTEKRGEEEAKPMPEGASAKDRFINLAQRLVRVPKAELSVEQVKYRRRKRQNS